MEHWPDDMSKHLRRKRPDAFIPIEEVPSQGLDPEQALIEKEETVDDSDPGVDDSDPGKDWGPAPIHSPVWEPFEKPVTAHPDDASSVVSPAGNLSDAESLARDRAQRTSHLGLRNLSQGAVRDSHGAWGRKRKK